MRRERAGQKPHNRESGSQTCAHSRLNSDPLGGKERSNRFLNTSVAPSVSRLFCNRA